MPLAYLFLHIFKNISCRGLSDDAIISYLSQLQSNKDIESTDDNDGDPTFQVNLIQFSLLWALLESKMPSDKEMKAKEEELLLKGLQK